MIISFKGNGGGSVTTGEVQTMIDASLAGYYTSGQTDSAIDDAVSGKADTSAFTNYYTSGETNNAISTALGDYYTSGETDAAISDAISDINFDKLASVSAFPQSANTGDVVAKTTEGAPLVTWAFPGVSPDGEVATVTNTFNFSDIPMGVTYKIASWTSIGNSEYPEDYGPHLFEYYLTHSTMEGDEVLLFEEFRDGEMYIDNPYPIGGDGADYMVFADQMNDGANYNLPMPFSAISDSVTIGISNPNSNGEGCSLWAFAYNGGNEYNDSLVPILGLQPFGPASEGTMDVYQYDGTNWASVKSDMSEYYTTAQTQAAIQSTVPELTPVYDGTFGIQEIDGEEAQLINLTDSETEDTKRLYIGIQTGENSWDALRISPTPYITSLSIENDELVEGGTDELATVSYVDSLVGDINNQLESI